MYKIAPAYQGKVVNFGRFTVDFNNVTEADLNRLIAIKSPAIYFEEAVSSKQLAVSDSDAGLMELADAAEQEAIAFHSALMGKAHHSTKRKKANDK